MTRAVCGFALAVALGLGMPASGQVQTIVPPVIAGAKPVRTEHVKIHGVALEGNLEGEAVDRDAIVYLPPSYDKDKSRRYPVVYALHGYFIGAEQWSGEIHVPQTIEGGIAQGAREFIVVLPDSKTTYLGSFYSSSVTTGDFENYIAHDVVAYMDAHYRTIASRTSRGLAGHSMGGYGATRIGIKHADVFGALYIMSPCCMYPVPGAGPGAPEQTKEASLAVEAKIGAAKSPAEAATALPGFGVAVLAAAAAWAPDPRNPPLYLDLPTKDGVMQPEMQARFSANGPLAFLDQYVRGLRTYRAIAMDVGDQDGLRFDTAKLHEALDKYSIPNSFEIYSGTHTSAVADRFQNHVMPFFSKNLCFTADCK